MVKIPAKIVLGVWNVRSGAEAMEIIY